MMKFNIVFLICMVVLSSVLRAGIFEPDEIVKRMEMAATWQFDNPTPYGALEWYCAPFYMGLIDLYEVTGKKRYIEYVKNIGQKNDWKIRTRPYHADDHAVGLSYIKMYQK